MIGNNKYLWWIIIATGFVVCGCNHHTLRQLYDVEEYVDSKPDSALQVLSAMDTAEVADGKCRAMYAYLTSYARYKSYIEEENDSTISRAVDYFREHNDKPRLMKSLYFKGYTLLMTQNYSGAIAALSEGEKLAEELGDDFFAGLCCRELARTFQDTFSENDFLDYSNKALMHFQRGHFDTHANYMLPMVCLANSICKEPEYAEELYQSAIKTAKETQDTVLFSQILRDYAILLVDLEKDKEALDLFHYVSDSLGYPLESIALGYYARAFSSVGETKKSSAVFLLADSLSQTEYDRYSVDYQKYYSALRLADTTAAFIALNNMKDYSTGERFLSTNSQALIAQRNYFQEQEQIASLEQQLTQQKLYTSILLFILLFLLLATFSYIMAKEYKRRKEKIQQERDCLMRKIDSLSVEHSKHLKQSAKTGMHFFNTITQVYWQNQPNKVVPELQHILEGLLSDEKVKGQLIYTLNETRNNLIIRLSEQVPSLNSKEILLYCYLASHLEHNTICSILGKNPGAVNAQIYRLRKKIDSSSAIDKVEFLDVIS